MKVIYLGTGGFWTTEAVYQKVRGVIEVIPGYMGGNVPYPSHEAVMTGTTGHAEIVKVVYDETIISLEEILALFFAMHDASAPNHVMNGIGSQYRSVIFYTEDVDGEAGNNDNGEHVAIIQRSVGKVQQTLPEGVTVATQVMSAGEFYPAEELHYGFYEQHPDSAYAVTVIAPKLRELKERFLGLFL